MLFRVLLLLTILRLLEETTFREEELAWPRFWSKSSVEGRSSRDVSITAFCWNWRLSGFLREACEEATGSHLVVDGLLESA